VVSSLLERELLVNRNRLKRCRIVDGCDLGCDSVESDVLDDMTLFREKKLLPLELLSLEGDVGGGDEP